MPQTGSTHAGTAGPVLTERRAAVRASLLDAAETLFAEWGYAGVTPADVAASVGIGRTTFYEYFTDMEDLLAALVEARLPVVTDAILATIAPGQSPRRRLADLAVRMVEWAVTDPVLGVELHQGLPGLSASTRGRIESAHRDLSSEFGRIYAEGVRVGEMRAVPGDLAAVLVADAIMAAAKVLMGDDDPTGRLDEVSGELVAFLFTGLGT